MSKISGSHRNVRTHESTVTTAVVVEEIVRVFLIVAVVIAVFVD